MRLFRRITGWIDRLRSTYWFVPSIVTLLAAASGALLTHIDRTIVEIPPWMGWAYGGGADGARALLSAIAGSAITVVSVTFSVLVVALTVASQHFGPRLLNSFMRDSTSQLVLGTFTGTFAYCLVVLRSVQGDGGDRYSAFVPHLAVTGGVLLTLVSVAILIYYVHHVASSMQVSEITSHVAHDLERSIERVYPEEFGEGAEAVALATPAPPPSAVEVCADRSGYLQEIDSEEVFEAARRADATVWMIARPGDFIITGRPIAAVDPAPPDGTRLQEALRSACVFGNDRTSRQDVSFAAQQLVEVALRALSPGVNEPFTAITCVDRLGQGLAHLARRQIPSALRLDEGGRLRVVAIPRRFSDLLNETVEPIVLHAGRTPQVLRRLHTVLDILAEVARRPEDREAIVRMSERVTARNLDEAMSRG